MSFCSDLRFEDLQRLRKVCQRVHKVHMNRASKKYEPLPLHEVDKWIESMGPRIREQRIKIAVDKGVVS